MAEVFRSSGSGNPLSTFSKASKKQSLPVVSVLGLVVLWSAQMEEGVPPKLQGGGEFPLATNKLCTKAIVIFSCLV